MKPRFNVVHLCELSNLNLNNEFLNKELFVASSSSTNVVLVYANDGVNNSDRVRSAFSKHTGIEFTKVRCCKLKNYKK